MGSGQEQRIVEIFLELARVDDQPCRRGVGHGVRAHEVQPPELHAVAAGFALHAMRNVANVEWERVRDAFSAFSAFLEERIAGLEDIRANGGGAHVMRRFADITRELATSNTIAIRRGQWIYLIAYALFDFLLED